MAERLGHALGWLGNVIAACFIGIGLYALAQAGGEPVLKWAAVVFGVLAFLIGRACRYVLSGG